MKTYKYLFIILLFSSCAASNYNPAQKYSPELLQKDYELLQNILEESHPSLYWYTPKDSMDYYFAVGKTKLQDSLNEAKFRNVLSYVISKINCGHTSVRPSKGALNFSGSRGSSFPLFVKSWPDTTIVTANISRRDSNVTRGVLLKSIDGRPIKQIIDSFFSHLSTDGYNTTHKYQTISNGSNFRNMYASFFGLKSRIPIEYIDTLGNVKKANLSLYIPPSDSTRVKEPEEKISRRERKRIRLEGMRNFRIDTALNTGFMEVNSFMKTNRLRSFLRQSFKELEKNKVEHLVVDMRANGGGSVTLSNLLTRYVAQKPFKIADSLYAIKRSSEYGKYQEKHFFNWLFLQFLTKKKDGKYHFILFENKYFKPRKKHHYDGKIYVLTGGNTFSAATLFTKAIAEQDNVTVIGEETGGSAYGNTAWLIPDITLPNTGVRVRLPLFRLVIDKDAAKGVGVIPHIESLPSVDAIRKSEDYKMDKAIELIKERSAKRD